MHNTTDQTKCFEAKLNHNDSNRTCANDQPFVTPSQVYCKLDHFVIYICTFQTTTSELDVGRE